MITDTNLEIYLKRQRKRILFSRFRHPLRKVIAPFFVAFGIVDFFYQPDKAFIWLVLRILFLAVVFGAFELLKIGSIRRKYSDPIAIAVLSSACWIIDLMIASSGGHKSLYMTGLILVSVTGVEMGKMDRRMSFVTYILSYIPAVVIIILSSNAENELHVGFVQSFFMIGMIFLSFVYRGSEDNLQFIWNKTRLNTRHELEKLRRTSLLNKSFPPTLRKEIEEGSEGIPERKLISQGVVGFADIIGSTSMANIIGLEKDWELKQEFFKVASSRALATELIVLNPAGDGFLFLANYHDSTDWILNVTSFFEGILKDFEQIKNSKLANYENIQTGVKIGVAKGPVILGLIGDENQMHLTAMGPEVNLASRLCDKATKNEMVVSGEAWKAMNSSLHDWETKLLDYNDIKGFPFNISAAHISRRMKNVSKNLCTKCGKTLSVFRNSEGFLDIRCPENHDQSLESDKNVA